MGLSKYGQDGFDRYMRNAFIRDPTTGDPALVVGFNGPNSVALQTSRNDNGFKSVPLGEFTWNCAEYPELGYRTVKDGAAVLWLARKPGRTTSKGLRPEVIAISSCEAVKVVARLNDVTRVEITKRRQGWDLAELVYDKASFLSIDKAVLRLLNQDDKAVAFAVTNDFAVTVWPLADANLALFYAGQDNPAALSNDGKEWMWLDICVRDVAQRRGIL